MSKSKSLVRKLVEGDGQPGYDLPNASEEMTELEIGEHISYLCQSIDLRSPDAAEHLADIQSLADKLVEMHAESAESAESGSSEDPPSWHDPQSPDYQDDKDFTSRLAQGADGPYELDKDEHHPSRQPKHGKTPERAKRGRSAAPEETQGQ